MKRNTVFVGLFIILSFPSCLRAQTASIGGTITDATGAAIPNAKVIVQNVDTGETRTAQTDEGGIYRITNLNPGVYDVRMEHANFNPALYSRIQLSVDQVLMLDSKLTVGLQQITVRVTGESVAPINLNDAEVGNLVVSRQIQELPMILRDPYQLVLLSPSVTQSNTLFSGFSVNGSRERSNNFMLDGADNNDPDMGGFPAGLSRLNPENTQEFRVLTNNYLPEFGRNNGAIIDIVTKQAQTIIMLTFTGSGATPRFPQKTFLPKIAARILLCAIKLVIRLPAPSKRTRRFSLRIKKSGASAPRS